VGGHRQAGGGACRQGRRTGAGEESSVGVVSAGDGRVGIVIDVGRWLQIERECGLEVDVDGAGRLGACRRTDSDELVTATWLGSGNGQLLFHQRWVWAPAVQCERRR
jgi:hypothetical protein